MAPTRILPIAVVSPCCGGNTPIFSTGPTCDTITNKPFVGIDKNGVAVSIPGGLITIPAPLLLGSSVIYVQWDGSQFTFNTTSFDISGAEIPVLVVTPDGAGCISAFASFLELPEAYSGSGPRLPDKMCKDPLNNTITTYTFGTDIVVVEQVDCQNIEITVNGIVVVQLAPDCSGGTCCVLATYSPLLNGQYSWLNSFIMQFLTIQ